MTLDNVIKSFEKCAKYTWNGKPTVAAEECKQMAEWLKDYKRLLDDCIRRTDMLDAVGHGTTYTSEEVQDIIKGIPSVTPQPSENTISRQAVIDAIDKWVKNMGVLTVLSANDVTPLFESVQELPSVTPQPKMSSSSENPNKWIPVSERLPEEAGMYLCSYDDNYVITSYFNIRMNEFNIFHEQVTAWMPMPTPYKQEVEENEKT